MNKFNYIILVMALVILGMMAVGWYQLSEENQLLRQRIARIGQKTDHGKEGDPYIAGPVKNRIIKGSVDLKACYKAFLTRNPEIREGNIKLDWQIDRDGRPQNPEVVFSQFSDPFLGECMIGKIRQWQFPPPLARSYVAHLFQFNDALNKKDMKVESSE
ncbi:AgmX/PglI C-terminal domain-containing protein [bacterium]|nr:AgmX/PglI C-terminal domain-containing protein [bacterium]